MFKKSTFDTYKAKYLNHLESRDETPQWHRWDAQKYFIVNWDMERLDFGDMYEASLQSDVSNRIWTGVDYHPKESMLTFIKHEKEFIRSMCKDLFNESKDLQMRINRFIYHCDELLPQIKKKESKLLHHYHDEPMVMAYLAFNNPHQYTHLNKDAFRKAMIKMDARNIPEHITLDSYAKLMRITQKFLFTDSNIDELYAKSMPDAKLYLKGSMLVALDFIEWIALKV